MKSRYSLNSCVIRIKASPIGGLPLAALDFFAGVVDIFNLFPKKILFKNTCSAPCVVQRLHLFPMCACDMFSAR